MHNVLVIISHEILLLCTIDFRDMNLWFIVYIQSIQDMHILKFGFLNVEPDIQNHC